MACACGSPLPDSRLGTWAEDLDIIDGDMDEEDAVDGEEAAEDDRDDSAINLWDGWSSCDFSWSRLGVLRPYEPFDSSSASPCSAGCNERGEKRWIRPWGEQLTSPTPKAEPKRIGLALKTIHKRLNTHTCLLGDPTPVHCQIFLFPSFTQNRTKTPSKQQQQ